MTENVNTAHSSTLKLQRSELRREGLSAERNRLRERLLLLERKVAALERYDGVRGAARLLFERLCGYADAEKDWKCAATAPPEGEKQGDKRPHVALVTDVVGWSFANIARQIERYLSDEFRFTLISTVELDHDAGLVFYIARDCDLIHFLWRDTIFEARAYFQASLRFYFGDSKRMDDMLSKKTTFTVYDHLFLGPAEIAERRDMYNRYTVAYAVCSSRLNDIYSKIPDFPAPSAILRDGVDLTIFKPQNLVRFDSIATRPLRVGWVGNSRWRANKDLADPKGMHTILEPAIDRLASEGYQFIRDYADSNLCFLPHEVMPAYYNRVDIVVCVSAIEGTPNPVLEAMACGVPLICTDVGVVPEVFGPKQSKFILRERSVDCLVSAFKLLTEDLSILRTLSEENLEQIQDWDWALQSEHFRAFFHRSLKKANMWLDRSSGYGCVPLLAKSR